MSKYVVELIGTFFLVLTIGRVVLADVGTLGPLVIGSLLMVMVYAGGPISGAHYNPAVTLALWLCGKCPVTDVVPYWVSQLVGAVAGGGVAIYLANAPLPTPAAPPGDLGAVFVAEAVFTFALLWVILNVATSAAAAGNSYFGLAIGLTVFAGAAAVGPISWGVFNPAVAVGLSVLKLSSWNNVWVYLAAQFPAAALAAGVFWMVERAAQTG